MDMTPADFFVEWWRHNKKDEELWDKTRHIIAMVHNASPNKKKNIKPQGIVELSKDRKKEKYEFDREWFDRAMDKLHDKRNQN
ncbi:MAG: hypothetical protein R6U65_08490 [Perlabentimonas sp.]